jgi:hypothetical protein
MSASAKSSIQERFFGSMSRRFAQRKGAGHSAQNDGALHRVYLGRASIASSSFRAERPEHLVLREAPGRAVEESLFDLTRATISGSVLAYTPALHRQNAQEERWITRKCF